MGIDARELDLALFLEAHTEPDDALLTTLRRETYARTTHPRMVGGPLLASVLRLLIGLLHPQRLLEIGTFTGYSAIVMARAAGTEARLDTLEHDARHAALARDFLSRDGLTPPRVRLLQGDARLLLEDLSPAYDLILADGDKADYPIYLHHTHRLLRPGGVLVADNVLWGGKTANPQVHDPRTEALRLFLRELREDPRYESCVLPVGDGLAIARRVTPR